MSVVFDLFCRISEKTHFFTVSPESSVWQLFKIDEVSGEKREELASNDSVWRAPRLTYPRQVPYCLMFHGGHVVHSKRLNGMRLAYGDGGLPLTHSYAAAPASVK